MNQWGYDETKGIIIGGWEIRYEFWQENKTLHDHYIKKEDGTPYLDKIASEYFESDEEALEWLKENCPNEYAARKERPIEMRVYDQPGKQEQSMIDIRKARPPHDRY